MTYETLEPMLQYSMEWILYALSGPALMAANNLIDKFALRKYVPDVGAYTIIYGIASFLFTALIFIIDGITVLSIESSALILTAGFIQVGIFLSYFKALTLDETSRVTPLFQLIPVFTLVLAWLFLDESLASIQLVGFVIIFLAGFALSGKTLTLNVFSPRPAFWYMVIASLGSASLGVIFKFVFELNTFWQTVAWENLGIGIGSLFLFLNKGYRSQFFKTVRKVPYRIYSLVFINESLFFLGRLGLRYAFGLAPVALVTVLMGTQPLFVLLYSIVLTLYFPEILKEDTSRKVIVQKLSLMILILFGTALLLV